ncbi:MAG TPA: MBOAT family O-acyltransferase [Bacteroidales bacterium]|nr:MBOAT family protein [Bacteroidales bacterium]HNW68662.1 MBOAT family O-acyltransferase [Bacteroidales bacterium]HPT53130.1 MBOAT family O-acyltransferase [Bacteroidales bacterium]
MIFSSPLFLFLFFPILLLVYYLTPNKIKNYILLIFSLFFYSWGEPRFIFVVVVSIAADYFIARQLPRCEKKIRKWWLLFSIFINVGVLLYAKYANFFVENLNELYQLLGLTPFQWSAVALPVGISFLTFQKISYVVDVYREEVPPQRKLSDLLLYILMFPQLVAGPIVRYKEIASQLTDRQAGDTYSNRVAGFSRFIVGLAKKLLIANVLAEQVDIIFALSPEYFSTGTAWIAIIAYTFQIYFDFSGYSDMALGMGKMLGFRFPENFNFPYISQSITEFWRRWHITLSSWMKDYLYIPLGGNRVPLPRIYFNLATVFFISGFWHGAAWTFIFWGLYHGFFLILEKMFLLKFLKKIGKFPAVVITFLIVIIGWVFFRSDSIDYAFRFIGKLFSFDFSMDEFYFDARFLTFLGLAVLFSFMGYFKKIENFQYQIFGENPKRLLLIGGFVVSVILYVICGGVLLSGGLNPFIYFRF